MSDDAVSISPIHFFDIVASMRKRAALREGQSALTAVDVAHDGGSSYIEALVNSVGEARTMIAASLEIAGRALVLAGTRVVDADMIEEYAGTFWELDSPYGELPEYESEEELDQWVEDQREYYDDLNEYSRETAEVVEGDG
jgi:hypothetical protein